MNALLLILLFRVTVEATADLVGEKEILLQFKGNVTADPYGVLTSWVVSGDPCSDFAGVSCSDAGFVEKILIHGADLEGKLSSSFSGLRDVQIISLFGNRFSGEVPAEYGEIGTLRKLNVSRNALSGEIPASLGDMNSLRLLDLGGNLFSGEIPRSLFKNCYRTRFVSFAHNRLTGSIPTSIANCFNLVGLNFSFNQLTGGFPPEICAPPAITFIALGNNSLSGTVSDKISSCLSLEFLDLGSNSFSGSAPFDLLSFTNLTYFNASFNRFEGIVPKIGTCSDKLKYIDASGNDLGGEIDPSIASCTGLRLLDLGFNRFTGRIPPEIGSIKLLSVLNLGSNAITGTIPPELAELELIQALDLHDLHLTGEIPSSLSNCRFLLELDLSENKLQGGIPNTFYKLAILQHLDLHHNELNGSIPSTLGQLIRLQFLDLAENSLSGSIPPSLENLTLLTHFNLSYNNLTGAIPSAPTIQQFGSSAFSHNPFLCGFPLTILCNINHNRTKVLSVTVIIAIVAAALILAGVCLITIINIKTSMNKTLEEEIPVSESTAPASTNPNIIIGKLVLFTKTLPSRYEDWEAGTKALLDSNSLIGGGSIGSVYKANLDNGITIAVKKLETLGKIRNQEEFEQEMSRLGALIHPNLVTFHGYYWSPTMQLILSEFVANGSLYRHLHDPNFRGGRAQLFWARRFQIALGTARSLAFLHHDCNPQVLHLNIKSSNVLIGEDYEAKLCDFGLVKLLPILGSKFHNSVGYVAPELASQSLRDGEKSDVFSFGMILMEIATGRKTVEREGAEVVLLREFVRGALDRGDVSDCFDRSLRRVSDKEVIQVLKLGLLCAGDAPANRPSMGEVVQFLESIRSSGR